MGRVYILGRLLNFGIFTCGAAGSAVRSRQVYKPSVVFFLSIRFTPRAQKSDCTMLYDATADSFNSEEQFQTEFDSNHESNFIRVGMSPTS